MNFFKNAFSSAALLVLLISLCARTEAATSTELSPEIANDYVHVHTLVDVGGGRKMHLYCRGKGAITVVFDSGLSDWSSIWALVQPETANRTRACTYDRAGMGYSDLSNRPSTPINIVDDLRKLLAAAGIQSPVVLVGHSLGGFNMKLFAATYPAEVAGAVLVDPSEELEQKRARPLATAKFGLTTFKNMYSGENSPASWLAHFPNCVAGAKKHDLDPLSTLYKQCTDPAHPPLGSLVAQHRQTIQVRYAYQAAQASEALNSVYAPVSSLNAQYSRIFGKKNSLGNLPLIVLSHSIVGKEPFAAEAQYIWLALHERTAASSTRGERRIVPNTHHNIEIDDPRSIVVAINDVLDMLAVPR